MQEQLKPEGIIISDNNVTHFLCFVLGRNVEVVEVRKSNSIHLADSYFESLDSE